MPKNVQHFLTDDIKNLSLVLFSKYLCYKGKQDEMDGLVVYVGEKRNAYIVLVWKRGEETTWKT